MPALDPDRTGRFLAFHAIDDAQTTTMGFGATRSLEHSTDVPLHATGNITIQDIDKAHTTILPILTKPAKLSKSKRAIAWDSELFIINEPYTT